MKNNSGTECQCYLFIIIIQKYDVDNNYSTWINYD